MSKCQVQPATDVRLANGLVHRAPLVHVTTYTKAECAEEKADAKLCTSSMAWPEYGAFRKDFVSRRLGHGEAAAYLEAQAAPWPGYSFDSEIAYYRARAVGERVCHACYTVLPPVPLCDCGCQAPPRAVAGFASPGACLTSGATAAAAKAPPAHAGQPQHRGELATHAVGPAGDELQPGANGARTGGAQELGSQVAEQEAIDWFVLPGPPIAANKLDTLLGPSTAVTLSKALVAEAVAAGKRRNAECYRRGAVHRNNLAKDFATDEKRNIFGCCCEIAARELLAPIVWQAAYAGPGSPDLGAFVDVKGIKKPHHKLVVAKGCVVPEHAYLLISAAEHPTYHAMGWLWGHELLLHPLQEPQPGRPAHVVGATLLRPFAELWATVRDRQGDKEEAHADPF